MNEEVNPSLLMDCSLNFHFLYTVIQIRYIWLTNHECHYLRIMAVATGLLYTLISVLNYLFHFRVRLDQIRSLVSIGGKSPYPLGW